MNLKQPSKALYKTELAEMYGVSWRTLRRRILVFWTDFKHNKNHKLLPGEVAYILSELPIH